MHRPQLLYPAPGLSERLAETRQFPPLMARKFGGRLSAGLLFEAVAWKRSEDERQRRIEQHLDAVAE